LLYPGLAKIPSEKMNIFKTLLSPLEKNKIAIGGEPIKVVSAEF
jgi:hypothetical protein